MHHANVIPRFLNVCESVEISVWLRGQITYMVVVLSEPCLLAMSLSHPFHSMASSRPYWSRTDMMTWYNESIFHVTGHLCGEFTGHRWIPHKKASNGGGGGGGGGSIDVYFNLNNLNKRPRKQSQGWWFETPSCPLWRHCNVLRNFWRSWIPSQCDLAICMWNTSLCRSHQT